MKPLCSAVRTQHKLVSRNVLLASSLRPSSKVVGVRINRSRNFVVRRQRGYSAGLARVRCSLTGDEEHAQDHNENEAEDQFNQMNEGVEETSPQGAAEPGAQDLDVGAGVGVPTSQNQGGEQTPSAEQQEYAENVSVGEDLSVNQEDQQIIETKGSKLAKMLLSFNPLELSDLQKNVSREAVMAIKRVLTGTFGTLPSEQYTVTVETTREVLSGLLRSALYTGYVLRNLEYRLSLHKTLLLNSEEPIVYADEKEKLHHTPEENAANEIVNQSEETQQAQPQYEIKGLPPDVVSQLPKEAIQYIHNLEQRVEQKIEQDQHSNTIDETDQLGIPNSSHGNDLLDLLRSLDPTTAKAMAKPSTKDTDHAFHLVIESVLSRLYPTLTEQSAEITDEQQISVTRDYLARILYWSMLLGNHGRSLEYNLSLEHAFEHINVEHPVYEAEGSGVGNGFFGAIGNFFFGENGQKAGEGDSSAPAKEDHKKHQQSSRKSEKDTDEMF